jgi:hypothetical protein
MVKAMAWIGSAVGLLYCSLACDEQEPRERLRRRILDWAPVLAPFYTNAAVPEPALRVLDAFACALSGSLVGTATMLSIEALTPSLVLTGAVLASTALPRDAVVARLKELWVKLPSVRG